MSVICDTSAPLSIDHPSLSLKRLEAATLRDLREAYESFEWEQMSYERTMRHYEPSTESEPVSERYTAAKKLYDTITIILQRINSVIIRKQEQECRSGNRY